MIDDKIEYRNGYPYYKGMPCFTSGLRLDSCPYRDEDGFLSAYYWRDCGCWFSLIKELYPNIFVFCDDYFALSHLYLQETKPMTLNEWANDNGFSSHEISSVTEALAKDGYGDHKGLKI